MNCDDFRDHLLPFVDGELDGAHGAAAAEHEAACADCRERVVFERALEARVGAALLSGTQAPDVAALLRRARTGGGGRGARRHVLRRVVAAAAVLLVAVQAAWFFCIPPFECSMLQAVEAAAGSSAAAAVAPAVPERLARLEPPAEIDGFRLEGTPEIVPVGYDGVEVGLRARYVGDGEAFVVVWCDPQHVKPSFRRRASRAGMDWWIADENGNHLVAWMCPVTETMCTLVADIPEDRLVTVASDMRDGGRPDGR